MATSAGADVGAGARLAPQRPVGCRPSGAPRRGPPWPPPGRTVCMLPPRPLRAGHGRAPGGGRGARRGRGGRGRAAARGPGGGRRAARAVQARRAPGPRGHLVCAAACHACPRPLAGPPGDTCPRRRRCTEPTAAPASAGGGQEDALWRELAAEEQRAARGATRDEAPARGRRPGPRESAEQVGPAAGRRDGPGYRCAASSACAGRPAALRPAWP